MSQSVAAKKIEEDVADREPVWDAMQMLFMDTEINFERMAKACADSKYTIDELREILFFEVFPALRFNLFALPGGEWSGFQMPWLKQRILTKNTRGRFFQPFFFRKYTRECWETLKPQIERFR